MQVTLKQRVREEAAFTSNALEISSGWSILGQQPIFFGGSGSGTFDSVEMRYLLFVSLAKRYVNSARRAQRGVSRALFHPEIASESNFELHLGPVLATVSILNVASKSHWCSHNLF